ncbi:MAG: 5-methyltetrahydrofolate--homocysteine methyltransferase [Deltaproteobacteria bacterium]|nr:MAG: 5-methyltetrahydrofolate--homocysteine methyltransferase [Deltaproteobacteria bacterium]
MNLRSLIGSGVLLIDGAMGTMLQERGLEKGEPPEVLNLKKPEVVLSVHREYLEAGAMAVTTNTFGGSRVKLEEYGLGDSTLEVNRRGAEIAREACGKEGFVLGSVGPTGKFLRPMGELDFDDAVAIFREQVTGLVQGGVDAIKIETMMDIREVKAAIVAAREVTDLPIIAMMTFQESGATFLGTTPQAFAVLADAFDVDVIGANCSVGPEKLVSVLAAMASVTEKPLIAQPNAGIPVLEGGKTVFPLGPEGFGEKVREFLPLGVRVVAGCCGTTPSHIREARKNLGYRRPTGVEVVTPPSRAIEPSKGLFVSSRSRVVTISPEGPLLIVGERINPTGKKAFSEELRNGVLDTVKREAVEQEELGAHILDVNVGAPGVDEESLMEEAVYTVNVSSTLPIMIDSANPSVIERGLKAVDGIPIINSVTGERKKLESVLPLASRYRASLICLLFDEGGITEDPFERLKVAEKILREAREAGIPPERLIIDCLTTTVSSSDRAPGATLETVRLVREKLGLPVILGVSNVSFGMPERKVINRTFLAMAADAGLSLAIMNPHDREMVDMVYAANLLLGKDPGGAEFIARFSGERVEEEADATPLGRVRQGVVKGVKEEILPAVEEALKEGIDPMTLNNEGVVKGLEEVGKLFDQAKVFLPQVIASAETAKIAFERIKEELKEEGREKRGKVLLATVEGDIHDIGKNIVGTLLSNHGFEVIDLGKNVPARRIVEEARRHDVDVVGLSALMTTTMVEMENVIELLRKEGIDVVTIVGGAVVTEEYARSIGAELYAKDAMDAVAKLIEIVENKGKR